MTKRSPKLILIAALLYVYLAAFALSMIAGASLLALCAFTVFRGELGAAQAYFAMGLAFLIGAYLANVLVTYFLTKQWSWRLTTSYTLQPVEKKPKK